MEINKGDYNAVTMAITSGPHMAQIKVYLEVYDDLSLVQLNHRMSGYCCSNINTDIQPTFAI